MIRPRSLILILSLLVVTGILFDAAIEVGPTPAPLSEQESASERINTIRAAFQSNAKPVELADPRLVRFFDCISQAAETKNPFAAIDSFDLDRLHTEVRAAHVLPRPDWEVDDPDGLKKLYSGVWKAFESRWLGQGWQSTEIRRVDTLIGGQEIIVSARHRTVDGVRPLRWWFTQRNQELFAFDVEDCRVGMRLSYQLAPLFALQANEADHAAIQNGLTAINDAYIALAGREPLLADQLLRPARTAPFPNAAKAMLYLTEAAIALGNNSPPEVLRWTTQTDEVRPGIPGTDLLRSVAHFRLKHWTEAITASRKYVDLLGPDPQASYVLSASLLELGKRPEALVVLETARRDFPNDDGLKELLTRFADPQ